ncbi:hypothetical protein [Scleromatobacter humisilvae]|uniref:Porin n=1 Tax=Scleromatobacter humisilvae TaxID=2897159 RepID=A0A9X1YK82_9BURK|nr:hypothetical protein [Scleromatobacter humisilvae]MCK9687237.1 hypothetical protein [Scleromatobacter humisilvae]
MNNRLVLAVPATMLACAMSIGAAHAQGKPALKPLDDAELSGVYGQALLDLTNTSQGGYDFSRITLNADITMSSSLKGLVLGTHADGTSDINISTLNFGRSDGTDAQRTVAISNPYFEWVYSGTGTASSQVIGMRIGFGGIAGDVGLMMNTVSGSLSLSTPSSGQATGAGSQLTSLPTTTGATIALNQIGGVTAGTVDGPSRDFFLSILKQAVTYPTTAGVAAPATAQAGFWLNWTDRLAALNTTGSVPPNVPKIGP